MFYIEEDISRELVCPKCTKRFNDPRLLPCGHSFCHDCIQRLVSNNLVKCTVCNRKHSVEVDASGDVEFFKNEFINTLLDKRAFEVKRGNKSDLLKQTVQTLNENRSKLASLYNLNECEMKVHDHLSSIRSQIDIITEKQIDLLNKIRETLLNEIEAYSRDCSAEIFKIVKDGTQFINEIDLYCQEIDEYMSHPDLDEGIVETKTETADGLISASRERIENFENEIFMNRKPRFEESVENARANLIGQLVFGKSASKVDNTVTTASEDTSSSVQKLKI